MKGFRVFLCALIMAAAIIPEAAFAIGLEAAVGAWSQSPGGDIAYKGESLSLKNDLKYGDEVKPYGRVKLELPILPNIYLMATPMEFKADGSKSIPFQFGNSTFNASVPFTSKVKLDQYDIGLYYGIPLLKTATAGVLNVDLGVNARIIDFQSEINQTSTGVHDSKSLTVPVPMLYAGIQVKPIKMVSAEAEFRGIAYGQNHYYDIIGRAKVNVFGPAFVAAGYRYEKLKIDQSDVKTSVNFGGPFGEVGVEF